MFDRLPSDARNNRDVSSIVWSIAGSPKTKRRLWKSWTRPLSPKVMKIKTFRFLGKWTLKVTSPKWSMITLRSFWASLLSTRQVKMAPEDLPQTQEPEFINMSSKKGYGTTPVGCRGGNRYVEGELLTFGYLVLDDSLGYPYFRLFNGTP